MCSTVSTTNVAIEQWLAPRIVNLSRRLLSIVLLLTCYSGRPGNVSKSIMRIYVFKSESTDRLRAFAGDPDVHKLPRQHGPWTATGTISPNNAPPYNLSRDAIEKAINTEGFQLWRLRDKK